MEDLLLQLVDDFVNSTVNTACIFAKHRNATTVEVKDVQLYLGVFNLKIYIFCSVIVSFILIIFRKYKIVS